MSSSFIPAQWERFLALTTDRQQAVADNIANVDTPGYRTQDVNFQEALREADQGLTGAADSPRIVQVQGLMQRPDGNNVDIDRESMLLAQTQLAYQMGTALVKDRFHQLLDAIKGES